MAHCVEGSASVDISSKLAKTVQFRVRQRPQGKYLADWVVAFESFPNPRCPSLPNRILA